MAPNLRLTITQPAILPLHERSRSVAQCPFRIGREDDNDWVIEDPARLVSRHHCTIEFKSNVFLVIDTSVNGLLVNKADQPLGRGNSVILSDGDVLHLANISISVAISDTTESARDPFLAILPGAGAARATPRAAEDDFFTDRPDVVQEQAFPAYAPSPLMPWAEDDATPLPRPLFAPSAWQTETQSDHAPAEFQALGPIKPVNVHIPDAWDVDEPSVAPRPAAKPPRLDPAPADPAGLPRGVVFSLVEALSRISRAADPAGTEDLLSGTTEEAVSRLSKLDPEWASLSLVSLSVRIAKQLSAQPEPGSGWEQPPATADWPAPPVPARAIPFDGDDTQ